MIIRNICIFSIQFLSRNRLRHRKLHSIQNKICEFQSSICGQNRMLSTKQSASANEFLVILFFKTNCYVGFWKFPHCNWLIVQNTFVHRARTRKNCSLWKQMIVDLWSKDFHWLRLFFELFEYSPIDIVLCFAGFFCAEPLCIGGETGQTLSGKIELNDFWVRGKMNGTPPPLYYRSFICSSPKKFITFNRSAI